MNYDGDTSGHEVLWVNMALSGGYWAQSGLVAGVLPGNSYSSTRYPYVEWNAPGQYLAYVFSSYPISGTDTIYAEDYVESYSGGNYYYEVYVYSTNYATAWYSTKSFGSTYYLGDPTTASETYYTQTSENCDLYVNYSSSLAYSSSVSSNPSWTSWSSSSITYTDTNYTYYQNSATSWNFCSDNYVSYC